MNSFTCVHTYIDRCEYMIGWMIIMFSCFRLWSTETMSEKMKLEGHTDEVNSVALSRDGKTIVSGSDDRTIK